jgi:hypothetical protein
MATPQPAPPQPDSTERQRLLQDDVAASVMTAALFSAIVLPTVLTLSTVHEESVRGAVLKFDALRNPTPYGYTVSLLIYLVPLTTLMSWFYRTHAPGSFRRIALRWTLWMLVPIGFGLDFLFGNLFFLFPNTGAILGWYVPGFSFETGGLVWDIPVEEYVFYFAGFFTLLLLYIWCNQVWVPAYGVSDYSDTSNHPPYIVRIHWRTLGIGAALLAAAVVYKKVLAPEHLRAGFPLYMAFLLLVAVIPGMLLHRCSRPFVNWRAFSITLMWVLLTSLLWEATLASPFGWWRYEPTWMMGLHISAWADLPVEAVVLWIAVSYTTISVYETVKVYLHIKKPASQALFGDSQEPPTAA